MAMKDVSPFKIKRRLRHKSFDTTQGYIDEASGWLRTGLSGLFDAKSPTTASALL
jgi:hypothetical protein